MKTQRTILNLVTANEYSFVFQGINSFISNSFQYNIVGLAKSGDDVLSFLAHENVDILVTDLYQPLIEGIELITHLQKEYPKLKIMIITMHSEAWFVNPLLKRNINVIISKNKLNAELVLALEHLEEDKPFFSAEIRQCMLNEINGKMPLNNFTQVHLTSREKEILALLADGLPSRKIAGHCNITTYTVDTHRRNLLNKFDVENTPALLKAARENGQLV